MKARAQGDGQRTLHFEIFRYDPADPESEPHIQHFELDERPYTTLFIALNRIREEQDPSLQFDFACRSAICGSCGMLVNGRPRLACNTLTRDLPDTIRLQPLNERHAPVLVAAPEVQAVFRAVARWEKLG